jgi:hypothetical protein
MVMPFAVVEAEGMDAAGDNVEDRGVDYVATELRGPGT